LESWLCLSWA